MLRKTKIVCTLGPASSDEKIIKELILAGMNVARFNFSHSTHQEHKVQFDRVAKLRQELNLHIATLLDTKGPEIRVGEIENGKVTLNKGDMLELSTKEVLGNNKVISISYKDLPKDVHTGDRILIDDGLIELIVVNVYDDSILCEVKNDGVVSTKKGINVPGVKLSMPYLSQKDIDDITFGVKTGFDFIAASFTRCSDDIEEVKDVITKAGNPDVKVIAKIENREGVENIDDILRVADGIMVARGDMGVEIPFEELPAIQKMLIKRAREAGKQVITATQMLDSMMKNPRPTRAETTDVANAIYDGTSAIMLSGETAAGLYPVEAVKTMVTIARETERAIDYKREFSSREKLEFKSVTNAISHATVTTAIDLNAAAIITVTKSGQTAKLISRFRPQSPIIGCSTSEMVCRQMNLSWGVIPILCKEQYTNDDLFEHSVEVSLKNGLVESGDLVVITAGFPLGIPGTTNIMKVHIVGNILVTGKGVTNEQACANLCVCQNEEEAIKNFRNGDILVLPKTSNAILELLKDCSGIITEEDGAESHAAVVGLTLSKPVIVGAVNATKILRSGTCVTMDAKKGLVSNGTNAK